MLGAKTAAAGTTARQVSSSSSKALCRKRPSKKKAGQDADAFVPHKQSSPRFHCHLLFTHHGQNTGGKKALRSHSDKSSDMRGDNVKEHQNWQLFGKKLRKMVGRTDGQQELCESTNNDVIFSNVCRCGFSRGGVDKCGVHWCGSLSEGGVHELVL